MSGDALGQGLGFRIQRDQGPAGRRGEVRDERSDRLALVGRQRLLDQGSTIVQTDQCGAGWWRSDSNQVRCERERNRRYWQHDVPLAPVRLQDPADRPG